MKGKSIFSWNTSSVFNGDPEKFANLVKELKFEAVLLKVADGALVHVPKNNPSFGENVKPELVDALKAAGIKVYLWSFLYGYNPKGELDIAIKQADKFKPDGYVWDVEGAFDSRTNAVPNARLISRGFKMAHPNIPQSLCWWALPKSPVNGTEWHPIRVALAWLEVVDSAMPMMYWQGTGAASALSYLIKSLGIWRSFTTKPLAPVGRSYNGDGGYATSDGIEAFANSVFNQANSLNLIGNSWWSLDTAITNPAWLQTLTATPKYFSASNALSQEVILGRLVNAHQELFPELFSE